MGRRLQEERMNLPIAEDLDGCNYKPLPYYLLGDEVFPLKPWLMRPFPGKNMTEEKQVCNYGQSRGLRAIENTFGILVIRWRIFLTPTRARNMFWRVKVYTTISCVMWKLAVFEIFDQYVVPYIRKIVENCATVLRCI